MRIYDLEYDGLKISDLGMMLARFDGGGGFETVDGVELSVNTISTQNGVKHHLVSSPYEDCLTFELQICRDTCNYSNNMIIDIETERDVMRLFNRRKFHKLRLIDTDGELSNIYFMATFNVSKIKMGDDTVGFQLNSITDAPFGYGNPITFNFKDIKPNEDKLFYSHSDLEGCLYPNMVITVLEDGKLEIANSAEPDRKMVINNCSVNEIITINYPIISSSESSHKINNDFEWDFYRISTSFKNRANTLTPSLSCSIQLTYTPIIKIGI